LDLFFKKELLPLLSFQWVAPLIGASFVSFWLFVYLAGYIFYI